jgi:hypothetical protein
MDFVAGVIGAGIGLVATGLFLLLIVRDAVNKSPLH